MKKITLFFISFLIFSFGFSQTIIKEYTFDDAGSISDWAPVADATNGAEASISYNASGNGTGALQLTGVNSDGVGGRAYIFELRDFSINYSGATSVDVSFDIKYDTGASLFATALQLQNQVPQVGGGVLTINNSNLETQGINESTWTNLSYTIVNEDPNFDNTVSEFYIHFNLAAGAVLNAGGTILVDNITVTNTSALDTEEFSESKFAVYPNPTTNVWNIKAQQTIQSVDLYDVLGKQVIMNLQPNNADVSIDASTLSKGLYFARISTDLGSNSIKLIKN